MRTLSGTVLSSRPKPVLNSYDSGDEFSLDHRLEICQLVNETESIERFHFGDRRGDASASTLLEMEPATTDENFAGNIV